MRSLTAAVALVAIAAHADSRSEVQALKAEQRPNACRRLSIGTAELLSLPSTLKSRLLSEASPRAFDGTRFAGVVVKTQLKPGYSHAAQFGSRSQEACRACLVSDRIKKMVERPRVFITVDGFVASHRLALWGQTLRMSAVMRDAQLIEWDTLLNRPAQNGECIIVTRLEVSSAWSR